VEPIGTKIKRKPERNFLEVNRWSITFLPILKNRTNEEMQNLG
jgi:hypothetical protein